jgi:hypothetical protein
MKELRTNGNTKYTQVQADMSDRYSMWLKGKDCVLRTTTITREEFIKLWDDSGKWSLRGRAIGEYTLRIQPGDGPVTIDDCVIAIRTADMTFIKHKSPEEAKAAKDAANKKAYEKRQAGKPPKVTKVLKPRKVPKQYVKSDKQMQKEINSAPKVRSPRVKGFSYEVKGLEVAIDMFYEASANPLNNKIRELAKIKPTNYRVHNLRTKKELAPEPKCRTLMTA